MTGHEMVRLIAQLRGIHSDHLDTVVNKWLTILGWCLQIFIRIKYFPAHFFKLNFWSLIILSSNLRYHGIRKYYKYEDCPKVSSLPIKNSETNLRKRYICLSEVNIKFSTLCSG